MPPSVWIATDNSDFYPVLAEQLKLQLGCDSRQIAIEDIKKQSLDDCHLLVCDQAAVDIPAGLPHLRCPPMPLRLQDLLAEIAAMMHKASSPETLALPLGCELQLRSRQIVHVATGRSTDVTVKEMQLLQALHDAGEAGLSREVLLKQLWGYDMTVDTHTLETHIYRLRSKLKDVTGPDAMQDGMIEAEDGGYRLKEID